MDVKSKAKEQTDKAREVLNRVIEELQPAKKHFLTANKELLLAIGSAIEAEIRLVDKLAEEKCKKDSDES
ncbi:MAG: hypothetical protein QF662_08130 [Phycisphaerae bacterium]|nr:hypothetical protein [Phycisphaerae bacterium]